MDIGWNPVQHVFDDSDEAQGAQSSPPPNFWTFMESKIPENEDPSGSGPQMKDPPRSPLARNMLRPQISSADMHEGYYSDLLRKDDDDDFFNVENLAGDDLLDDDKSNEAGGAVGDWNEEDESGLRGLIKIITASFKGFNM
jgi:hypothetical protein